jgi:hypothetical protein
VQPREESAALTDALDLERDTVDRQSSARETVAPNGRVWPRARARRQ